MPSTRGKRGAQPLVYQRTPRAFKRPADLDNDPMLTDWAAEIPAFLYRYSSLAGTRLNRLKELLLQGRLFFPSPRDFNDPLDCKIAPSFDASSLAIETFWRTAINEGRLGSIAKNQKRSAVQRMIRQSKTAHGKEMLARRVVDTLSRNGTVCLSTDPLQMLMWSYYSDGHRGVVIRFNMKHENLLQLPLHVGQCLPIKVNYAEQFPVVNYYTDKTIDLIRTVIGTKALAWQHEREWRLVRVNQTGLTRVPLSMIDGIILGLQISPEDERSLRDDISASRPDIEILRVAHEPNSFNLRLVSVT